MRSVADLNCERAGNWRVNALRAHAPFRSRGRERDLWIFSAWEGMRASDNPWALFCYVRENHPEVRAVWQTRSEDLFGSLRASGVPVQLIGTSEAERTQRRAGVAVYSHGVDDFGPTPRIYGAYGVFLGHGVSFKLLYRAQLAALLPKVTLRNRLGDVKWRVFNYLRCDATLAPSAREEALLRDCFMYPKGHTFLRGGLPRNDRLAMPCPYGEALGAFARSHPGLAGKRMVLYMPTFRRENDAVVADAIARLRRDGRVAGMLQRENAFVLCKMHYLSSVGEPMADAPDSSVFVLRDAPDVDVQGLLAHASMLITDYSSCAVDFALTGLPVGFFYPDGEVRCRDTPTTDDFESLTGVNRALSFEGLAQMLADGLEGGPRGVEQARHLNRVLDETDVPLGSYAAGVYRAICDALEARWAR